MDSSSENPNKNFTETPLVVYPLVKTILAFLALVATSYIANTEKVDDQALLNIFMISVWEGMLQLASLKLIAVPCAFFVSMRQRWAFKYSYYKALEVVYFVPYASFFFAVIILLS